MKCLNSKRFLPNCRSLNWRFLMVGIAFVFLPLSGAAQTLSKTTLAPQPFYAIGEQAQFRLTITVPPSFASATFFVTDVLPGGLNYNGGSLSVVTTPGITAANAPLIQGESRLF